MGKRGFFKIIAFLLCFALIFSVFSTGFVALAEETTPPVEDGIIDTDNNEGEEDKDIYANALDVSSSQELETALAAETEAIRIVGDFYIDRTFYVISDVVIYTDEAHTLTRASDFGGDVFVVGQYDDGTVCEDTITLMVGRDDSVDNNMLVIDGNRDNMTAEVVGTVFFGLSNSVIELYANLTVQNCKKVGNERTMIESYNLSYPDLIGGPVAIIAAGKLNIYGGVYDNNATNAPSDALSNRGGAFYLFGNANIYGGTFSNNCAYRGGALYIYRTLNIYGGTFSDNYATGVGGVAYIPASAAANLYIEGGSDLSEEAITFKNNLADSHGGVFYSLGKTVNVDGATFEGNSTGGHGGVFYSTMAGDSENINFNAYNSTFKNNSAAYNGGAFYLGSTAAYLENVTFEGNHADATPNSSGTRYGGGAFYTTGSYLEINGATFNNNSSDNYGGGIESHSTSQVVLNDVTTSGNSAVHNGGFIFANNSAITIYNSAIRANSSNNQGGALYITTNATLHAYLTTFENNYAKNNGGAMLIYTDAVNSLLHSCVFLDNTSDNYGGGIYVSNKSILDIYNSSAKGNKAFRGGFLYETTTGTTVTLNGISVSSNYATDGGPIIWGNSAGAKLLINKTTYTDVDYTGTLDDAYWASAIVNSLKVTEINDPIPGFVNYGDSEETKPEDIVNPNVTNAHELQAALNAEIKKITILSDFALDRTFYVTGDTTIYTSGERTLTRAPHFGGDIFVIGEYANGETPDAAAKLTIDPSGEGCSLTIDGNRDNMTVPVVGTVFFVGHKSNLVLRDSLTVKNCYKSENQRTLNEEYGLSYTHRIGGPVIINAGSTVDIYGGLFTNNSVLDEGDDNPDLISTQGGVIYSFGNTNIFGGTFEGNHAARGGALYNYRKTYIHNASFIENTASNLGGAVYMAASTACYLYLGASSNVCDSYVLFKDNQSGSNGGAILSQGALTSVKNTDFIGNTAGGHGGAVWSSKSSDIDPENPNFTIEDSSFNGNTADVSGGALYLTSSSAGIKNVDFIGNHASATANSSGNRYGGGVMYSTGSYSLFEGVRFTDNTCDYAGGALYFNSSSESVLYNITATKNHSTSAGGFMYSKTSTVDIYNSTFKENSTDSTGGALNLQTGAVTNVYSSRFEGNAAKNSGGALNVYTDGAQVLVNGCEFLNNTSDVYGGVAYVSGKGLLDFYNNTATGNHAAKGGYLYITTTGTIVKLSNATIKGNTATDGGPIIWGNSTGAKLYIDKNAFTDLDAPALDSNYWAAAIVNKLSVYDLTDSVPECKEYGNENYENLAGYVEVYNSEELEEAINGGNTRIRIMADFKIDRTFYITHNVTIFSTTPYRLTRAEDFAGDIFVVGEDASGKSQLLSGKTAVLTLGNPESTTENLLTIDGNRGHMTVPVVGSVIFLCHSANVNLYNNVSIINAHKEGNEKTLSSKYYLGSYSNRIGGAMAIVESGELRIYGGQYRNLSVNDEIISDELGEAGRASTLGGAIYSLGEVNVYGGTFEYCKSARGGAVYNYRTMRVFGGDFINNYAYSSGGAVYLPSSPTTQLFVGSNTGSTAVTFKGNISESTGGAVYSGINASTIVYGDTLFEGNQSLTSSGGAIAAYGTLCVDNSTFKKNIAYSRGGAAYITKSKDKVGTLPRFRNCAFENNEASSGGAVTAYGANGSTTGGANVTFTDCSFKSNKAKSGGAINASYKAKISLRNTSFTGNTCESEGGAIYMVYESVANLENCDFSKNTAGNDIKGYGGAISAHSSFIDGNDLTFNKNTAGLRGGAIYVSYNSASLEDSVVNLKNATFTANHSHLLGGGIYVVDRKISYGTDADGNALPKEDRNILNLILYDTTFDGNTAVEKGGGLFVTTYAHAFMDNVTFKDNKITVAETSHNAGAIYSATYATFEIDGGTFTGNETGANAGAIGMYSNSSAVMNDITATGNKAPYASGFLHCDTAYATIYNSNISQNTAGTRGGAAALVDLSTLNAYNTRFDGNTSTAEGGALYIYPGASQSVLNGCSFDGNQSGSLGGAIYIANASLLDIYNATATNNSANKGGFLYETTKGSIVKINGLTVSGNTDDMGGPIIWGNTLNAKLFINKNNYVDKDASVLDDAYWAGAIYNLLTVGDENGAIPAIPTYKPSYTPPKDKEPTVHPEVSVEHIFELAQNADHGKINSTYSALPKLDNSSNFMSKQTTLFPDINGEDVTVDSFIYHKDDPANNCTVGEGLMIYQAMCYKRANPDEDVSIALSAYRISASTALCIDRESPYFGYIRALYDTDYDKYGFVRLSYLLLCAARMGINVTVIGQLDGYPTTSTSPRFESYFTEMLDAPCDSAYVEDGVIGDFMKFRACKWQLEGKGGSDMMHTKLCAVSHYLDKDGNVHRNAVWTSSSNLDGVNANATNALNQLQTATIVSDHAELYRISTNYLDLLADYCEQEDVYYFRELVIPLFKEQIDLIKAGRENEIPRDEQMVYLGSENDPVFELYFSPFAGAHSAWEEDYNPFTAQVRNLNDSEGSIIFIWNNVKFGEYSLRNQLEQVIINAFQKNKHPDNKIYVNLPGFDSAAFNSLKLGTDIGYKAFNQNDFGSVHSKDMHLSYVKDGQRYYVSLLNSMNVHAGSMVHQSNFALLIKETDCDEDSVFFTFADETTVGIVSHEYEDTVLEYIPENEDEDGYTYHPCANCDEKQIIEKLHRYGDWQIVREATAEENGIAQRSCSACNTVLEAREYVFPGKDNILHSEYFSGEIFSSAKNLQSALSVSAAPLTIEATVQLDKSFNDRAGVIVGNYEGTSDNLVNLEVATYGRIRLYIKNNGQLADHTFKTDIRGDDAVHIAVSVEGTVAKLYIDSELKETAELAVGVPAPSNRMWIGGDNRLGNAQFFKGTIFSVNLFDHVRTAEDISRDMLAVFENTKGLLASKYFVDSKIVSHTGISFTETTPHEVGNLTATPHTIEATVQLSESFSGRAGVIFGNYENMSCDALNFEIDSRGRPRIYYIAEDGTPFDFIFDTDIRGEQPVHLAITIGGRTLTLYINGEAFQSVTTSKTLGKVANNFKIGGDNRIGNAQYFKGIISNVTVFSDVRTADEIKADMTCENPTDIDLLYANTFSETKTQVIPDLVTPAGITFTPETNINTGVLPTAPLTIETIVQLDKSISERAGVIVGNYNESSKNQMNLEVYSDGRIRLFLANNVAKTATHIFSTDIRGEDAVHIAVTIEGTTAKLYINSVLTETAQLSIGLPTMTTGLRIGGDNRIDNTQYFKGTLYSVNLFDTVRSAEQIANDMIHLDKDSEGLMFSKNYALSIGSDREAYGIMFNEDSAISLDTLSETPHTLEATVQLGKDYHDRGGVIVGNFTDLALDAMNLEIHYSGRVRLFYALDKATQVDCIFNTDIRGSDPVHIAVTIDGNIANLYINGKFTESKNLAVSPVNQTEGFKIGGDNRPDNSKFFKGAIYNVSLFGDVRTEEEIRADMIAVSPETEGLLFTDVLGMAAVDSPLEMIPVGESFNVGGSYTIDDKLAATPHSFEAVVQLSPEHEGRGGVIVGNYKDGIGNELNLEIHTSGRPRIYYTDADGTYADCIFNTDIRSETAVHIAVTIDGLTATLYVNGQQAEQQQLSFAVPSITTNFKVGSDNRAGNAQFFKGTIYSVNLFGDARSAKQVASDIVMINASDPALLYGARFATDYCSLNGHAVSGTVTDFIQSESSNELRHTECSTCGKVIEYIETPRITEIIAYRNWDSATGLTPSVDNAGYTIESNLESTPMTFEAVVKLDKAYGQRAGVIFGNYDGSLKNQLNLEIYTNGRPRLYYSIGTKSYSHIFNTDIRSDDPTHIALTVDGLTASLYVNGVLRETMKLTVELPDSLENFKIGCDNRTGTPQNFAGTIYSVNLFGYARTAEQIAIDRYLCPSDSAGMLLDKNFMALN